ncbi:Dam family site-specific DNA-(adenine-N6)-methyltransferase [Ralstonia sp. TCR112]|uniref:DNA adenine methylase n=1 Tax=Ralstonia sp. TCR112 TaxID=2601730 RepID=UPI0011BD61E2|nr:Dam family site-specific DNA-(adenine-N6)-methyltransferase [Ralstonia sp. TCR112]TXD63736.1 Dam family site-specific DNA-(adenine-N6)-methyltransferase [Ralstonia sp. TCR112]
MRAASTPLIKWPGGKRALLPEILSKMPSTFGTYYEPFFGGGAVFFGLAPENAVISDANEELVNAYIQVRDNPDTLIKELKRLPNAEEVYYRVRASNPKSSVRRAARLLYLTRLSFNGIHRVNLAGQFNVPYGKKSHLSSVEPEKLLAISELLQGIDIRSGDFKEITNSASAGDLVYFDPPYTVAHAHNGFVKYNERIFSWSDQERLAEHARQLASRGCHVVISNADHASIHELYKGFECTVINRPSVIAASSAHRRTITECIFVLGG